MKLPIGVYAFSEDFAEKEGIVSFVFKGVEYEAEINVNAYANLEVLKNIDFEKPVEPFCGYCDTPVIIMPAGLYHIGRGPEKADKFRTFFPCAVTILGENAGVSPNGADLRTPTWTKESVVEGSFYFGAFAMHNKTDGVLTLDGLTLKTCKIFDERVGGENVGLVVKNCSFDGYMVYSLIKAFALEDPNGKRFVHVSDVRADGIDDRAGEGRMFDIESGDLTVERFYFANTDKFIGFTDYSRSVTNRLGKVTFKDSIFENCNSTHGIGILLPDDSNAEINIDNCQFLNVTTKEDPVITMNMPAGAKLNISNTKFVGNNTVPVILVDGDTNNVAVDNVSFDGFTSLCEKKADRRTVPCADAKYALEDPHSAVNADFSVLNGLYEGRKVYFGDFHCHSNSGGTSDGKFPIEDYIPKMKELNLDFASIVDHKQMLHYFLPCWDEQYQICGTEPGLTLNTEDRPEKARGLHYTMIFPDKTGLAQVMGAFPQFGFTGTKSGVYQYYSFTPEEFRQLAEYIYSIGGLLSHAHPKQMMDSDDPMDYYFGDHVPLETIHVDPNAFSSIQNHDLWVTILNMGKRIKTHGSSDCHSSVSNRGLTSVYSPKHHSTDIFNLVRAGDCSAGGIGIQMSIDDCAMGGVTEYADGKTLYVSVGDFHPAHKLEDTVYSVRVYTEKGLAYAEEFSCNDHPQFALPIQKRSYYRVEIWNESDNLPVAFSNPIWLD